MLSPLSRGYGTWSGRVEYSQPDGPSRESTFPSIGERNLTGISLSASIGTKLSAPTAPLQPPQPPTREPSYGEMYLPKTYLTRKGALLLFTAPESELDDNDFNARWQRQRLYKMRRDRVAKLIDLSLRLGNLTRLSNSVLRYGNQDFDPEDASISDEKNKQFLKFLQNLDQKEVDTHAKPGGDLEFYLRDLKSRGSARYVVSGDTYLPKSRISQELQALLHGLDANCPPFSQEAGILGERSHSRLSDQFTRPVSRASSRAQSPGSAPPPTPKSYNVLSCKKLTASIKSSNYLGRPSSTEPLQEYSPAQDVISVGISPAEEGTDGSGFEGYISPLNRKLFRMPGTQPSVAGSSIAEEEESQDNLSRTLKERATSPGMPLIYQGREVKGCSGEGKGDGEGPDLHKGEVDKFEIEGKRVTEVKYSEPDDAINAFIESDPLDEFSEGKPEITEVSMEISQKRVSQEDMMVVEDDSAHINESDRSGTVDQSDMHIINETSDHEAEEHDSAHQIKEKIDDNLPEETVYNGDITSENEVEEEHCTETHSMSEKLSQKEDDKISMSSGQTDLTSEKSSVKVPGVSHVEIKVTDKVARVTSEEVDVKAESDIIPEEIDKNSNFVTNQSDNNQAEVEVLEVVKEKEEKEKEVVVVEDGEHMKMGEVTGEESEDEDKVDEVLLERFRRGGSLFSMQSEDVLAQYQDVDIASLISGRTGETIHPPSERDNLERQNEDHILKIETKEKEVKRPHSAKSKASISSRSSSASSRSSSASRPTSARVQKTQSVPSRPSSVMNRNVVVKSEEFRNQSMDMVSNKLVKNKSINEVLEKEFVENESMYEVLEKKLVENEILERGLIENKGIHGVLENELVENEVFEKELVENKDINEVLENELVEKGGMYNGLELVENEGKNEILEIELVENEDMYEVLKKHLEYTEADKQVPLMSETQVASIGVKTQKMNKETLDEKQMIGLSETNEISTKSEVASVKITEGDTKAVVTENVQKFQQVIIEPVKGQDVNTKTWNGKAMLDVPKNKTDHSPEIPRTEEPIPESKINHRDQNITDIKSGKMHQPSRPIKSENNHSTLEKIAGKSQEAKTSDIRKPVVASPMKRNEAKPKLNMKVKMDSNSRILKQREMTQVHKKDEANNLDGASKQLETETDASSKSELSHLTQLAQSIGGKVPKAPGKGKKLATKNRQKSSTSLDKTDTVSETTSSVGSKRRESFKIPEHLKDAMARRPSLSKEELEKEMERMSEMVDATLSGPTLHNIGEGLTEEELELAKQILQEKMAAAKEKLDDPKGQGKKSPVSKSASSRKSKKRDDKSDIEKEQEAIREKHEREKKNREEEVRALQEKIAERKAMLKQQKDLNEAKTKVNVEIKKLKYR
ncbi:hypothetical protein ACJMK2_028412, partial [Sinanodonta woodiana]